MTPQKRRYIQVLPSFSKYDAIGNNVRYIDNLLREKRCVSYVSAIDGNACDSLTLPLASLKGFIDTQNDIIIFHMAIGNEKTSFIANLKAYRKIMIFHNITPPSYFYPDNVRAAELCALGEKQLREIRSCFDISIADSDFNAKVLKKCGYSEVFTVPLPIGITYYDSVCPDVGFLCKYYDNKPNILFVGRGTPNKCQHDVVMAFVAFRRYFPASRLLLAGGWYEGGTYRNVVEQIIRETGLSEDVELLSSVTDAELKALYLSSHLFLCMSEHEGFCVPLLEAMYFGVPILAFAAAAVPETLGGSGVLFYEKDYEAVAQVMVELVTNSSVREKVISSQKSRVLDFEFSKFSEILLSYLGVMRN
jgi:glycosyltransferase involved in cell wall biosynthesis